MPRSAQGRTSGQKPEADSVRGACDALATHEPFRVLALLHYPRCFDEGRRSGSAFALRVHTHVSRG